MSEDKEPPIQHIVRCKAMHANIEAMEYILNNLLVEIQKAYEAILYNKNESAINALTKIKPGLEALSTLHEATEKLNTSVLQF